MNHSQHLSPLQSLDSRLLQNPQPAEPVNAASKTGGIILIIIAVTAVVLSEGRYPSVNGKHKSTLKS